MIRILETVDYYKVSINNYSPIVNFSLDQEEKETNKDIQLLQEYGFRIEDLGNDLGIFFSFEIGTHVIGLGEKAYGIDRKRKKFVFINTDPGGYIRNKEPIYLSIPFFMQVLKGKALGVFVNHPGEVVFDFGVEIYDKTKITIKDSSAELFIFKYFNVQEILKAYFRLTGKPFLPPKWSIGHTVSRYSYYPESEVIKILDEYLKTTRVEAIYLDIHYMNAYRLFTWNNKLFGDVKYLIEELHRRGIRIVTIIDPSVKFDQKYKIFREGLGHYVETQNGDVYNGPMWPGDSVFPDFLNSAARQFWKAEIREWVSQGIDGIWLDMNEPTVLTESHLFSENAIHNLDNGEKVLHSKVRNSYPYFQNMATYEAFSNISKEPFILTRSGYAGVQKYAAVWTGDNVSSWDDIKMQISIVTSLSISGITVVGCDLGGFSGDSTPEMISAYYKMALFFPLFRNHKIINGNDQEIFLLPTNIRKQIKESVDLRYDFIDYIFSVLYISHKEGVPSVSPLAYEFPSDDDTYYVEDEYMLGGALLYAPQIYKNQSLREVYLPEGKWIDFWEKRTIEGPVYIKSSKDYPIYMQKDSCVIYKKKIFVYGSGSFTLYLSNKEVRVISDGKSVSFSPLIPGYSFELMEPDRQVK